MHFMNPQRGAHLGLQPPLPAGGNTQSDQDDTGIGTAQAGYATPENGPFECGNCVHFDGKSACDNPQVQQDPEVQGQVDPEGCCNLFRPAGGSGEDEEEGSGEDEGAIPGAGEQI
jgi:hypothetical protein